MPAYPKHRQEDHVGLEILADQFSGKVISAQLTAVTAVNATATTGTLPTPDGSVVIANAATPTVVELQEFCVELNAKLATLLAALK